jgi:hypothetical protein
MKAKKPKHPAASVRPRAGDGTSVGTERYRLLRAAFRHAQSAALSGQYLEAIAVQESLLTDRLASLVGGSLGARVTLRHTLGDLIDVAEDNIVLPRPPAENAGKRSRRAPLPDDVRSFATQRLRGWWKERNHALHGMAKIHRIGDAPFRERYEALRRSALLGFVLLLQLDAFDQRERATNGARRAASWPNAFATDPKLEPLLFHIS